MTRQVGYWRELAWLGIALCAAACDSSKPAPGVSTSWDHVCVDMDGDGYGFQCGPGDDCDESDPDRHEGCETSCSKPAEGCACEDGAEPADCRLPYTLDKGGSLLCHTGTRYCRDGAWSGCEGVVTFSVPPPLRGLESRALIEADAGSIPCSEECDPTCRRIEDKLTTPFGPDAGVGTNVVSVPSGGVMLTGSASGGAGLPALTDVLLDTATCLPEDVDCDGLPAPFDADPMQKPSGTSHKIMFFDVAPGASQSQRFRANALGINSLDVYLYTDATGNMNSVLGTLADNFMDGNFLPSGGAGITCLDGSVDKKTQGIAGNLACTVRDVRFGFGWFREIPFPGPIPDVDRQVAPWDMELYEHEVDITDNFASVSDALASFDTRWNWNTPEGGMQGLWSIATGEGLYVGWNRPGVPPRQGCPAGTFGYPCFRDEALPVVLMLTDAPQQNGPPTANPPTPSTCLDDPFLHNFRLVCDPLNYPASLLTSQAASDSTYHPLTTSGESFTDPQPVGLVNGVLEPIDGKLLTYVGDTTAMQNDFSSADGIGCILWDEFVEVAPDVVFRFRVGSAGRYLISARGTRFDSALIVASRGSDGKPVEMVGCDDEGATLDQDLELGVTPEVLLDLVPGDYYAVLKGQTGGARGWFQVTIGQPGGERASTFDAKRWSGAQGGDGSDGIQRALLDKGIRTAVIQAGNNPYTEDQALAIASATGAVVAGVPVRGSIGTDGTSLGNEVVRVLRQLANNPRLDVSLALDRAANPGFGVVIEALDPVGSGCARAVDGDDPDGLPDTFEGCTKGATPQFRVTLTNPSGAPVPLNAADPTGQGGYPIWAQVLGNGHLVLDRLLVYALPKTARAPTTVTYPATGVYAQSLEVDFCTDTEGPLWRALSWEANLPVGTSIRVKVCGAETAEQLSEECTQAEALQALSLTRGVACTSDADCGGLGYCERTRTQACHIVTGPGCMADADCGSFGRCAGTPGHCTNTAPAIGLYPVAQHGMERRRFARVFVELESDSTRTQAPTLLRWNVNYTCAPLE